MLADGIVVPGNQKMSELKRSEPKVSNTRNNESKTFGGFLSACEKRESRLPLSAMVFSFFPSEHSLWHFWSGSILLHWHSSRPKSILIHGWAQQWNDKTHPCESDILFKATGKSGTTSERPLKVRSKQNTRGRLPGEKVFGFCLGERNAEAERRDL